MRAPPVLLLVVRKLTPSLATEGTQGGSIPDHNSLYAPLATSSRAASTQSKQCSSGHSASESAYIDLDELDSDSDEGVSKPGRAPSTLMKTLYKRQGPNPQRRQRATVWHPRGNNCTAVRGIRNALKIARHEDSEFVCSNSKSRMVLGQEYATVDSPCKFADAFGLSCRASGGGPLSYTVKEKEALKRIPETLSGLGYELSDAGKWVLRTSDAGSKT